LKAYWDTSALVEAIIATSAAVTAFNAEHERITRAHTLAETFSQLTKGTLKNAQGETIALLADDAAKTIEAWAGRMTIVTLDGKQILMVFNSRPLCTCPCSWLKRKTKLNITMPKPMNLSVVK
jgi:hypothetical protein